MTWEELLKRVCPLAKADIIMGNVCPYHLLGEITPSRWCNTSTCKECWQTEVPPEVLKAHGIDELDRLRAVAEAAKALLDQIDVVAQDERYQAVWCIAQAFRGPYDGPQYKDQVDALRVALKKAKSGE